MLPLHEVQTLFRRALTGGDAQAREALVTFVEAGDLSAEDRIAIYANNVTASLTDVLKETFPAVCRLVGEKFFSYAAHEFIAVHPPARPALAEYGAQFAGFLASFPPCRDLRYLPDVARFEWLMNAAAHAGDAHTVGSQVLASIAPDDAPALRFRLDPSIAYLASEFPIDAIWRANRFGGLEESINLRSGAVFLEVRRVANDVVFLKLDHAGFEFRRALRHGAPLGRAIERAFAIDPEFHAADSLGALFSERAVAGISLSPILEDAT